MPVEIRELYIKINIEGGAAAGAQVQNTGTTSANGAAPSGNSDQDKWAQECVEQVMKLLERKEDR